MLKDLVDSRYSARTWLDANIEQSKIDYILHCALNAPSKQSRYPYKIYALANSNKANAIKQELFWERTWCVDGNRAQEKDRSSEDKIFNGQYRAPLLLLWTHRKISKDLELNENTWQHYLDEQKEQNLVDMTVSASYAMLAAEEQGLRTCFGRCHPEEISNQDNVISDIGIAVGIGYAKVADIDDLSLVYPVFKTKSKLEGFETRNLPQSFPKQNHILRKNKPALENLYEVI